MQTDRHFNSQSEPAYRGAIVEALEPDPPTRRLSPRQLQFLLRVTAPALESQRAFEIPACVTIAQSILESATAAGWGTGSLFRIANNPFGIKCGHLASQASGPGGGEKGGAAPTAFGGGQPAPLPEDYGHFDAPTWEIENGQKKFVMTEFRGFRNLDEAFLAHAQLLRSPRYEPAFAVRNDWRNFAERLGPKASAQDAVHCGYSTNPSYAAVLVKLVEIYRLDDPRAVQWYATGVDPEAAGSGSIAQKGARSG